MEGITYFSLSEEMEQDLKEWYRSFCDDLSEKLRGMGTDLENLCNQMQYKPAVDVVNKTIELFNGEIFEHANRVFDTWKDGDGSIAAAARNFHAGDEAVGTAKQLEEEIQEIFNSFWNTHPLGEGIQLDTGYPKVKNEDFDELKEIYRRVFQEAENLGEGIKNNIRTAGDENPTYKTILPAVEAISGTIKSAFEKFTEQIDAAKEESTSQQQQQEDHVQSAFDSAKATSATAEEVANGLKMFDDL